MAMTTDWNFEGANELRQRFFQSTNTAEPGQECQRACFVELYDLLCIAAYVETVKQFGLNRDDGLLRDQDDLTAFYTAYKERLSSLPHPPLIRSVTDLSNACHKALGPLMSIALMKGEISKLRWSQNEDAFLQFEKNGHLALISKFDASQILRVLRTAMLEFSSGNDSFPRVPCIEIINDVDRAIAEIQKIAYLCKNRPKSSETTEVSQPKQKDVEKFVFRPRGDVFEIAGFGEHGLLSNLAGLRRLHRLVRNPGRGIKMVELVAEENSEGLHGDSHSQQPALDRHALSELNDRLSEAQADWDRAKTAGDFTQADLLQREIVEIRSIVRTSTGLGNHPRDLNNPINKLRPQISGSLNTAYKKLRICNPPLQKIAEHFEQTVSSKGDTFIYDPRTAAPSWLTDNL